MGVLIVEILNIVSFDKEVALFWEFPALDSLVKNEFLDFLDFLWDFWVASTDSGQTSFDVLGPVAFYLLLRLGSSRFYKTDDLRFFGLLFLCELCVWPEGSVLFIFKQV